MAGAVALLCSLTSLACAVLLLRSYYHRRVPLLLWSGLCFVMLAVSNNLLFFDIVFLPTTSIQLWRSGAALTGILFLLYGLIWEAPS